MKQNIGTIDRIIRVIVGISLFFTMRSLENDTVQIVFLIASIITIFTALTGWCGLYKILGINTCKVK
jgi:hypothetical protein